MPNWCSNSIRITGKKEPLDKLKEKVSLIIKNKEYFMEGLIGWNDQYTRDQWYDHNCKIFGTKWDFKVGEDCDGKIEINDYSIDLKVETAWSPIEPFLKTLCRQYNVKASIGYWEPNMDYEGNAFIETDGAMIDYYRQGFIQREWQDEDNSIEISDAIKSENIDDLPDVISINKDLLN